MKLEPDSGSDESVPTLLHLQVTKNVTIKVFKLFYTLKIVNTERYLFAQRALTKKKLNVEIGN